MKTNLGVLLLTFIFLACGIDKNSFKEQLSKENLIKKELKTLNISLMIPQEHTIFEVSNGVIINLNPQERNTKQMSIEKVKPGVQKDKFTKSYTYNNGAILHYFTLEKEGGSGGTEYELKGIFEFEDEEFLVTSTTQNELGKGKPEFCLKYLSTIETL